jgi:hypothetical protein
MRRVYKFGLLPPVEGLAIVRDQLRAAREYRNDLVAIERGRRYALRLVDDTPEVRAAESDVRAATTSARREAIAKLRHARKAAREANAEELARVQELDEAIRRDARALTRCFWGTYLDIEAAHQQSRSAPLYGDDAVTPNDPAFVHPRADGMFDGQVGIQIQASKPMRSSDVWSAHDSRVRIEPAPAFASTTDKHGRPRNTKGRKGLLALRVGSDGRAPIWARWPIWVHREIPHAAQIKWVRVSVHLHGPHERWSCEITVDDPTPLAHTLDTSLTGAVVVQWCWEAYGDDTIRVARWSDTLGGSGEVLLPGEIVRGIVKADGIRAVRDKLAEEARPAIGKAIAACTERMPPWLARAAEWVPLTKSPIRLHDLLRRWTNERIDACRDGYELLRVWADRDAHLWEYETGARRNALGWRRDVYRVLARRWSERYRTVLLSDQDLSREARWGEEGTARFRAACDELRGALRNAFGEECAVDSRWRDAAAEDDARDWCERTRDAWMAGGARGDGRFAERKEKTGNAWAARKAKKLAKVSPEVTARDAIGNRAT